MCIVYRVIRNNKWRTLVTNLHVAILKHYTYDGLIVNNPKTLTLYKHVILLR